MKLQEKKVMLPAILGWKEIQNKMRNLVIAFLLVTTPAMALDPLLPNHQLTPGATLPVTEKEVCVPGYAGRVRNVPQNVKNKVYQLYGIPSHKPGDYEVDHLISLELGGANEISNLWPQSFKTLPWNAHVKDELENKLHQMVCDGKMTLKEAQDKISGDWTKAYCEVFGITNCNGD